MKKTSILMTGATGFLGSNLLKELLNKGYDVTIIKRSFSNVKRIKNQLKTVKHIDIDKTTIQSIFKKHSYDIILHCATDYGRKNVDPLQTIKTNLELPLELLQEGLKHNVRCFINTDTILDKRINHYSLSKKQFKQWLEVHKKDLVCINVALEHFYGPYDDKTKFVSFIIDRIISGSKAIDLTKGEQKRDFIYIDDVVKAFIKIIDNVPKLKKGFYNFDIGTNFQVSIKQFVGLIKELASNKTTKLNFGALPYRKHEVMRSGVNASRIKKLGWVPKYSLKEGLMKTIMAEKGEAK